jgi:hypothetical protein
MEEFQSTKLRLARANRASYKHFKAEKPDISPGLNCGNLFYCGLRSAISPDRDGTASFGTSKPNPINR